MPKLRERFGGFLNMLESRWSLWTLLQGSGLVASFALPAWAARSAQLFADYAPFSWVVAGFAGVTIWAVVRVLWQGANRLRVRAKYDGDLLERGSAINPLDMTFERKRIFVSDLVLPSHPYIDGKTFIDCDLIGPANIYFHSTNQANPIRLPKIDGVWLAPKAGFNNGFFFNNCIFRNCSFQRITVFASIENFALWKDNTNLNWVSIPPTTADIEERMGMIGLATIKPKEAAAPLLEDHRTEAEEDIEEPEEQEVEG
jgi:hypothetical protein